MSQRNYWLVAAVWLGLTAGQVFGAGEAAEDNSSQISEAARTEDAPDDPRLPPIPLARLMALAPAGAAADH